VAPSEIIDIIANPVIPEVAFQAQCHPAQTYYTLLQADSGTSMILRARSGDSVSNSYGAAQHSLLHTWFQLLVAVVHQTPLYACPGISPFNKLKLMDFALVH